jgi:hypothetical protein
MVTAKLARVKQLSPDPAGQWHLPGETSCLARGQALTPWFTRDPQGGAPVWIAGKPHCPEETITMFGNRFAAKRLPRTPRPCFQPKLEALEDRITPTGYFLTNLGAPGSLSPLYFAAINNAGQVATTIPEFTSVSHAVLYSDSHWADLGTPSGVGSSVAFTINDAGQILVQVSIQGVEGLFIYDHGNWSTDIYPSPLIVFTPIAMNNSEQVLGTAIVQNGFSQTSVPLLYSNNKWIPLIPPSGSGISDPQALGLDNSGQVLLSANTGSGTSSVSNDYLYDNGQWNYLGTNSVSASVLNGDINDSNQVVIGTVTGSGINQIFLYSNGQWSDLGAPNGYSNPALQGFTEAGQVLAIADTGSGSAAVSRPVLYANGQWADLNSLLPPGSTVTLTANFVRISNNGMIVAEGSDGNLYLLTPQPSATAPGNGPGSGSSGGNGAGNGSSGGNGGGGAGTPAPVGGLSLAAFGFGPSLQLDIFEVDQAGQVFAIPLLSFFSGATHPTFIHTDVVMANMQLLNGDLVGYLLGNNNQSYLVELLDFSNPYVFHALESAMF